MGRRKDRLVPRLAYVLPTIYLVVVFIVFQSITISSTRNDPQNPSPVGPTTAFVLTLPWSLFAQFLKGPLYYLPMVIGTLINTAALYFLCGGWRKKE